MDVIYSPTRRVPENDDSVDCNKKSRSLGLLGLVHCSTRTTIRGTGQGNATWTKILKKDLTTLKFGRYTLDLPRNKAKVRTIWRLASHR